MQQYTCQIKPDWNYPISPKAADIMQIFGLTVDKVKQNYQNLCPPLEQIDIHKGDIVFITGHSGSGKSLLFNNLYAGWAQSKIDINQISLPTDNLAVDNIDADNTTTIQTFIKAGLGDVFTMLNSPAFFSEGQKYRYRLAKAVSTDYNAVFADEFCSNLDRITASVVAFKIARHIRRSGKTFIAASAIDDITTELQPDITIICKPNHKPQIIYKN